MINIVLYKPDIPQNTAAIVRLSACFNLKTHIIEPCGFNLDDSRFKRVVMDYMDEKLIKFYQSSEEFFKSKEGQRVILLTTKSADSYTKFKFESNDTLLFGRESAGVPEHVHNSIKYRLKIPMMNNKRSIR